MLPVDITGKIFGKLTAIKFVDRRGDKKIHYWLFHCDCGKKIVCSKSNVKSGKTLSCGCIKKTLPLNSKGKSYLGTNTYRVWVNMKGRCSNKNIQCYKNYGGRGIKVCDRWMKFENFLEDMGEKPNNLSLDRINVNGDYEVNNCRWATNKEQSRNMRNNSYVTYKGKRFLVIELAETIGITPYTLRKRLNLGLDPTKRRKREYKKIDFSDFSFSNNRVLDMKNMRDIGYTLEEIGKFYGISRERVRQILDKHFR